MTYYFRYDRLVSADAAPKHPYGCQIRTPTPHLVNVCSAADAEQLRAALLSVFHAGKETARREMRDALGLPSP